MEKHTVKQNELDLLPNKESKYVLNDEVLDNVAGGYLDDYGYDYTGYACDISEYYYKQMV